MTKTFTVTIKYYGGNVTLVKTVTDKMEERNTHKRAYAANYFNKVLIEQYGRKHAEVAGWNLLEV